MDDIALGDLGINLVASLGLVAAIMLVTCLIGARLRRHSIVDIVWGFGFVCIAWLTVALSTGQPENTRVRMIAVMTSLWGLRLAGWLAWRNRGADDRRYVQLMKRAKGNPTLYALRNVYLVQGAVMWVVSMPVQFAGYERGALGSLAWVGLGLYAVGLIFESVGDFQLARFKRDPDSAGKVMDRGLWAYTRHPNYFGDVCVWWGIFLVALGHPFALLSAIGPLVMTHFLVNLSGKALLERHLLRSRPGYDAYVARTSGFVPLPPRRG
jgi:steroid 5-alpha reductase family enzyme